MRILVVFLMASLACAQQTKGRIAEGFDSIQVARLRADLTFLSSDALEGRRSLERGSEVAIQWIASEFAKAGLKPLVGASYLQPVPLIEFTADRALTSLVVRYGDTSQTYHAPDATANFANEVAVSGQVVFGGYGISAPELAYDDYAGIDVKGKVVLIFGHEPQENDEQSIFNGRGNTRYANATYKALNAQRHGAIGILSMTDPNNHTGGAGRGGSGGAQAQARGQLAQTRPRIPRQAGAAQQILHGIGDALQRAAQKAALEVLVHRAGLAQRLLFERQRQRVVARTELLQAFGESAGQLLGGKLLLDEAGVQLGHGCEENVVAGDGHGSDLELKGGLG